MNYKEFLEQVIDEGIKGATEDYKSGEKLDGSIAGFEACRNKEPLELIEIFKESSEYANKAHLERADNYWYFRCYQLEVEWVCNVVSALLYNEGRPTLLAHLPTARGMMMAARIIGVRGYNSYEDYITKTNS